MTATTFLKIEFNNADDASMACDLIKKTTKSFTEKQYETELSDFEEDIDIENNMIIVEESYSLLENAFLKLIPMFIKEIAKSNIESFDFVAIWESYNCGCEIEFIGDYKDTVLTIKNIISENGDGMCPECGEQVVIFDEYDPNEKYYCPECGEELDHLEMFDGCLPEIIIEEIVF